MVPSFIWKAIFCWPPIFMWRFQIHRDKAWEKYNLITRYEWDQQTCKCKIKLYSAIQACATQCSDTQYTRFFESIDGGKNVSLHTSPLCTLEETVFGQNKVTCRLHEKMDSHPSLSLLSFIPSSDKEHLARESYSKKN